MRKLALLLPLLIIAACETAREPAGGPPMPLVDAAGQTNGTVRAWQTTGGIGFRITAAGLPHGLHGVHVHSVAPCDPPGFPTAAAHRNPAARKHGTKTPEAP